MDGKKEDRRVRRTKRLLRESLSSLLLEKDLTDISVREVTERADLNRGTFYLHYTSVTDLLQKMEDEVICDLRAIVFAHPPTGQHTVAPALLPMIEYFDENSDLCQSLFAHDVSATFSKKFYQFISEAATLFLQTNYPQSQLRHMDYFSHFICYGIIGVVSQWFHQKKDMTPAQVTTLLDTMICSAAQSVMI